MELEGKTVIVSGAGGGIGRGLALEFARNGARVVCCARRKQLLDETVGLIEKEGGVGLSVATDITRPDQVQRMVATTLERFGAVHVLFNNAGSFQFIGAVHEGDPATWWQDVTVNLYGTFLMTREVLPSMLSRDEGIVINMGGGRPPGGSGYACSKVAILEFTRVLAEELKLMKSSVMVFTGGPGLVRTEMTEFQANTAAGRKWIPSTKELLEAGHVRRPEEIARATIKLIEIARPELSGKQYGPDTDFSAF